MTRLRAYVYGADNKFKSKTVLLCAVAAFAALVIGWSTFYVLAGVSHAIALNGPHLIGLQKEWVHDGSPEPPPIKDYVAEWTGPERYVV